MLTQNKSLSLWLNKTLANYDYNISKLAGDASLRQYYRITFEDQSRILMDSSLDKIAFKKFMDISSTLEACNLHTPKIFATNNDDAFALIEDFGDNLLLNIVNEHNREVLYKKAVDIIIQMQKGTRQSDNTPVFTSQQILAELNLFNEWYINKHLKLEFTQNEKQVIDTSFNLLVDILLSMPQEFSHMDYHSRNLIVIENDNLGIIDFQDAKISPFTYDLVSILKDCYIKLPQNFINQLLDYFYANSSVAKSLSNSEFIRAFNLCGLQRHIKVLGIFSRLHIRDNKTKYLQDIPLVLDYTLKCLEKYPEFSNFYEVMKRTQRASK